MANPSPAYVLRPCPRDDPAFRDLVAQLDGFLAVTDGDEHDFYAQFNHADTLDYALVLEAVDGRALACGALRAKSAERIEVKRMYVVEEARGGRLAVTVLRALEAEALRRGFREIVLETGIRQPAAIRLYEREGYTRIEAYPPYAGVDNSVCFGKSVGAA